MFHYEAAVTVGCQEADLSGRLEPCGRWTWDLRDTYPVCYIDGDDDGKSRFFVAAAALLSYYPPIAAVKKGH